MIKEEELIAQARNLEEAALAQIYNQFSDRLYRYAYRQLGQQDWAEECVAATFSSFILALHRGKGPKKHLQAYLYRIAHNWITDQWRRMPPTTELVPERYAEESQSMETTIADQIALDKIRSKLHQLTPEQRQVIVLKFLEGWENKEIARAMKKSVGSVKALQHRALENLKNLIIGNNEEL